MHRLLGATSVVVVAAVVATCLVVVFDIVRSWRAAGADVEGNRQLLSMIVWGNLGAVLATWSSMSAASSSVATPPRTSG